MKINNTKLIAFVKRSGSISYKYEKTSYGLLHDVFFPSLIHHPSFTLYFSFLIEKCVFCFSYYAVWDYLGPCFADSVLEKPRGDNVWGNTNNKHRNVSMKFHDLFSYEHETLKILLQFIK